MNLNQVDISKLPSDIRKEFKEQLPTIVDIAERGGARRGEEEKLGQVTNNLGLQGGATGGATTPQKRANIMKIVENNPTFQRLPEEVKNTIINNLVDAISAGDFEKVNKILGRSMYLQTFIPLKILLRICSN